MEDNQNQFNWFHGDQLPAFVRESLERESGIRILIILFVFTEEETVEDVDDNDGIDIEYQRWLDKEITNFSDVDGED